MKALGATESPVLVVLAPGDMGRTDDSGYHRVAAGLAQGGLRVVCFDAPAYDVDDAPLAALIRAASSQRQPHQRLVLGGLSRGARVSVALAESLGAAALLAFAYPFHGRHDPDATARVAQLAGLSVPILLFQGTRDSHGNQQQVRGYRLPEHIAVHWLDDANHALHPRARSGTTQARQLDTAASVAAAWLLKLG